jgi:alpha-L-fucosidase
MSDISEEVNRFKHLTVKGGADDSGPSADRFKWWNDARFGWFTSWGLFSLLERGEWVMHRERIPKAEYALLADRFNPKWFNADEWVALAQEAGMKYMYFMPRHHDGFCMWDTKTTDYSTPNTIAKRDFMAECVEACRKADMRVGFYYSVMDWRLPAFWNGPQKDPDGFAKMREYVHEQVRELVTNYDEIDLIWGDAKIAHRDEDWKWQEFIGRIKST